MDAKISVEKTGEVKRSIRFEIPRVEYDQRFETLLNRTTQGASIKGFRPGHAPRAIVAKMYQEKIHRDVLSDLISNAYENAVRTHELRVVGSPSINIDELGVGSDLTFTADVDLFPEPEIKDYFGLSYHAALEPEEVADEEIDAEINKLREQFAEIEQVADRDISQTGDVLTIDYDGTVDGQRFNDSVGTDVIVEIGKGDLPPELETGLAAMKIGETKTIKVVLPERSGELAGKEAEYAITLKAIGRKVLPPVDDELAKRSEAAEDLAGLRKLISDNISRQRKQANERALRDRYFEALAAKNPFEIPQILVDEEIREILFELGVLNRRDRKSFDMDVASFRKPLAQGAEFRVRRYIMLEQIIEQEKMAATDEEVNAWLDRQAADANRSREEIEKAFGLPKNAEAIKRMVTRDRAIEQLLAQAKVEKSIKPAGAEDAAEETV